MTAAFVTLMALGLAAAVGYPLWKGVQEESRSASAMDLVVQNGVAYADPDELALDQALGRVGGKSGVETASAESADLEALLEQQVARLRESSQPAPAPAAVVEPPSAPAAAKGGKCPQCGAGFDPGDAFCVRCGASLSQVCPNCGYPHEADDLFCSHCGQKL